MQQRCASASYLNWENPGGAVGDGRWPLLEDRSLVQKSILPGDPGCWGGGEDGVGEGIDG